MKRCGRCPSLFRAVLGAWLLTGAAGSAAATPEPERGTPGTTTETEAVVRDPLEPLNRGVFWFNEQVDRFALEPVARGWAWIAPEVARRSLRNFFENLRFPIQLANHVLQAKPGGAVTDVGRFVVNSTVGIAGLFDPATRLGWETSREDFGQTLGVWRLPAGPYLVLPLLGPSNPRDTVGLAADGAAAVYPYFVPLWASAAAATTDVVNRRSFLLEEVRENRRSAFDYYVFVRNAYLQYRENQVRDSEGGAPAELDEDLYYWEEEE